MKPVRIALIGAGGIVSHAHKPAFQQFPEELLPAAAADPIRAAAEGLAGQFGVPKLFNLDIYQNVESYVTGKPDPVDS